MNRDQLIENIGHIQRSIALLHNHGFNIPLLILAYSLIDILSWLDRSDDHDDVSRTDFLSWADLYIKPEDNFGCSSLDLYGARCSIVHSYSSESKLSRDRETNRIFYLWGNAKEEILAIAIKERELSDKVIIIRIETFIKTINHGINEFIDNKGDNELVLQRASKFFMATKSKGFDA